MVPSMADQGRPIYSAAEYSNLFQDAADSMRLFMLQKFVVFKYQKAASHCLTAILQMAQT